MNKFSSENKGKILIYRILNKRRDRKKNKKTKQNILLATF